MKSPCGILPWMASLLAFCSCDSSKHEAAKAVDPDPPSPIVGHWISDQGQSHGLQVTADGKLTLHVMAPGGDLARQISGQWHEGEPGKVVVRTQGKKDDPPDEQILYYELQGGDRALLYWPGSMGGTTGSIMVHRKPAAQFAETFPPHDEARTASTGSQAESQPEPADDQALIKRIGKKFMQAEWASTKTLMQELSSATLVVSASDEVITPEPELKAMLAAQLNSIGIETGGHQKSRWILWARFDAHDSGTKGPDGFLNTSLQLSLHTHAFAISGDEMLFLKHLSLWSTWSFINRDNFKGWAGSQNRSRSDEREMIPKLIGHAVAKLEKAHGDSSTMKNLPPSSVQPERFAHWFHEYQNLREETPGAALNRIHAYADLKSLNSRINHYGGIEAMQEQLSKRGVHRDPASNISIITDWRVQDGADPIIGQVPPFYGVYVDSQARFDESYCRLGNQLFRVRGTAVQIGYPISIPNAVKASAWHKAVQVRLRSSITSMYPDR